MPDADGAPRITVKDLLWQLTERLPRREGLDLTGDERRAILDLARVAAHASERVAAPLATFVLGVALADVPASERARTIERLAAELSSNAADARAAGERT